ncbi:MAG: hypothetical protein V2I47_08950, partial [Bacteroidales bacterium]|nr:hypothetical protein [Bacteroidales bacterium]
MKSKAKHLIVAFLSIGIIAAIAISCNKDDEENIPDQVPTLTTSAVFNITNNSATSGGNISDNYDSPITARGVCWSTEPDPNVSDSKTVDGLGIGPFQSEMTGLAPGQT